MLYLDESYFEEGRRTVKIESGNTKTGLVKQGKISRDHQPFDSNGADTAGKQGASGGKTCGSGSKKSY